MRENLPSCVYFACAVTCLALAVLSARLARAPATRHFRYSAAASSAAALYCLSDAVLVANFGVETAIWVSRIALAMAGLHQAAWLRFVATLARRDRTRAERLLEASCLIVSVLVLLPGVGFGDVVQLRTLAWLGVRYAEPRPQAVGYLSIGISILIQVHIIRDSLHPQRQDHRHARALAASFVFLLSVAIIDALTVTFRLPLPLLASLGFVTVSVGIGTVMVAAAVESARSLDAKSSELDDVRVQLAERQRLAALGELAAVVAHEVRNPVAVVFNALAGLRRLPSQEPNQALLLGIIEQEANRLKRLVTTLLDAVRPFDLQLRVHDLSELIANAVALATQGEERASAEVTVDIAAANGTALACDDVLLTQALANLLSNALAAQGRHSPVLLRVVAATPGHGIRFEVTDDGEGVAEVDRARIFSPFFTTRATGTGLGLTLVKRILEAHAGAVFLEAPAGGGARFVAELPATALPASP